MMLLSEIFFGSICGISFQIYKLVMGEDSFWNIRLSVALILGILLFHVINQLNISMVSFLVGRYDKDVQIEDMKAYLPLCLLLFFPLQNAYLKSIWPRPLFGVFVAIYVFAVFSLKCRTVAKMRSKAPASAERDSSPVTASLLSGIIALALFIGTFWLHQITLIFDAFGEFESAENAHSVYVQSHGLIRKGYLSNGTVSSLVPVPYEHSGATIGYGIMEEKQTSQESAFISFILRVEDRNGKLLDKRSAVLDTLDDESDRWQNFELDLRKGKKPELRFVMKARPAVLERGWEGFIDLVFRSPLDFSRFRSYAVRIVWSEPEISLPANERPNIILISLDTLRADALGCYGYDIEVSPTLDDLALNNTLYENAFSQSSWTLPSHLSVFTGLFPTRIKYMHSRREPVIEKTSDLRRIDHTTIAEVLRQNGYYCAAFTEGGFMSSFYGLHKGFHLYDDNVDGNDHLLDGQTFKLAQAWLAENQAKQFFLFIHTYTVHHHVRGITPSLGEIGKGDKVFESLLTAAALPAPAALQLEPGPLMHEGNISRRDWYDLRVKLVDLQLRELFAFLKKEKLYDNTLIVVFSDHGESFEEAHNDGKTMISGHGHAPYDSQTHVPLIIKFPASKHDGPFSIQEPVELTDIAPTILAVLGIKAHQQFQGRNILPGSESTQDREYPHVRSTGNVPVEYVSIRSGQKKYIGGNDGSEEFYDLATDPGETNNLANQQTGEMLRLRKMYLDIVQQASKDEMTLENSAEAAPEALKEQLRALGYM